MIKPKILSKPVLIKSFIKNKNLHPENLISGCINIKYQNHRMEFQEYL